MKLHNHKRIIRYSTACALIILLIILVLELTNTTHIFHSDSPKPIATTGGALTKGVNNVNPKNTGSSTKDNTTNIANNSPVTSSKPPDTATSYANVTLLAPWGTFVNTHTATVNQQMGSTCNTNSGATCQIIFTNGSTSKSLDIENTDSGGAVYWSWKPSEQGLTPGTWHITAKAVLGTQIKTTNGDPLTLDITE